MKLQLFANGKTIEITQMVTSYEWSGSASEAARKLTFGIISSPTDKSIPQIKIGLGNTIILTDEKEVFRGFVRDRSKSYSGSEIEVTAYDGLLYLLESSGSYNVKKMTAEDMTRLICKEIGVEVGEIAATGIYQKQIYDDESFYKIITAMYARAGKQNGKTYKAIMNQGKLDVIEFGTYLTELNVLYDSSFSETLSGMVNKVKIQDENLKVVNLVSNESDVKNYGTIMKSYKIEKDVNSLVAARAILKGPEQSASIEAPGNLNCIMGHKVKIKDGYTGIVGEFWIASDTHTWQNGQHRMSLELTFKGVAE